MRLIDADKLMLSLNDNFLANSPTGNETLAARDYRESICEGLEIAMATVEGAPTVDAAPVKHGRWVMDEDPHDGDVRCSACLIAIDQMHERNHKLLNALTGGKWYTFYSYCPQCGAKMDLEEKQNGTDNP